MSKQAAIEILEEMAVEYDNDASEWYSFAHTEPNPERADLYIKYHFEAHDRSRTILKALEKITDIDTEKYGYIVFDGKVKAIEIN